MIFYALAAGMEQARQELEESCSAEEAELLCTLRWFQSVIFHNVDLTTHDFMVIEQAYAFYIKCIKAGEQVTLATVTPGSHWRVKRYSKGDTQ